MLLERARRHYEERGWSVEPAPAGSRAELLVSRKDQRRLVRVDEDALGAYEVGALAAHARRTRVQATVVCPVSPDVIEACEQFGVEYLSPEGLGEDAPVLRARVPVVRTAPVERAPPTAIEPPAMVPNAAGAAAGWDRRLRWSIVGLVWLAAAVAWVVLLARLFA